MCVENQGIDFDDNWIESAYVNQPAVENRVQNLSNRRAVKKECQVAWLLRAVTCMDMTTLCGDDSFSNVQRLCFKAAQPIQQALLESVGLNKDEIQVGAICVYPSRVADCRQILASIGSEIPIAAVASGFPSGQYSLKTRLQEIEAAVEDGAKEIDIVISRDLALRGKWKALYEEVKAMKEACGKKAHMKTILATGELGSFTNVYKASLVCMMAGADFIKTSTGKESINATLPVGIVMTRAIKDYYKATGFEVQCIELENPNIALQYLYQIA